MKNYRPLIYLLAFSLICTSFSYDKKEMACIKNGTFKINGQKLSPDWKLENFMKVLGRPDSATGGDFNRIYTYHYKGIVLIEPVKDTAPGGKVSEIQFHFSSGEVIHTTPFSHYSGTLKVQKLDISSKLSYEELKRELKDWRETDSYAKHVYKLSSGGIYIYFYFTEDDKRLIKLAIGREK